MNNPKLILNIFFKAYFNRFYSDFLKELLIIPLTSLTNFYSYML